MVIAGSLAQKAYYGGHSWVILQYVLGFGRLGWDVLLLDRLEPEMCRNDEGQPCGLGESTNLAYFLDVVEGFGLGDSFALFGSESEPVVGLSRRQIVERIRRSALVLDVMGFFRDEEVTAEAPTRVFLDIDPGFSQMWLALGLADTLTGYDAHVTIGERIGQDSCGVPTCGIDWVTTRQPVVLGFWPVATENSDVFTSVASWRGSYAPIDYDGKAYGLRVHEFRKFARLPRASGRRFEVALDIHPAEVDDLNLLAANGWALVDPKAVTGNPWSYRRYVQSSLAELMIAKNMYVEAQSGWFSDRSVCYLASGKPVVAQDTGLGGLYPADEGLLTFRTPEEALFAVEAVCTDYARHARAARALADDCFDSDKVLAELLAHLSVA